MHVKNIFADGKLAYDSNIHIQNDFTCDYLNKLGFEWTDIDYEYVKGYVEYFRQLGYLKASYLIVIVNQISYTLCMDCSSIKS